MPAARLAECSATRSDEPPVAGPPPTQLAARLLASRTSGPAARLLASRTSGPAARLLASRTSGPAARLLASRTSGPAARLVEC